MNPSEEDEENNNNNLMMMDKTEDDANCYELGPIYLHRWIDCQDEYDKWYEAQIIDISPSNNNNIKVHYKGWKSKFDTWIDLNSEPERARLLHTFTDKPPKLGQLETYALGTKCDCLDSTDKWYEAEIMEENDNGELVRIHYKGWDSKYDEWINKDSYRIAPLHTMTSSQPPPPQQTDTTSTTTTTTTQRVAASISVSPSSKKRKGSKPKNNVSIVRKPKFQRNRSDASNSSVRVHRNYDDDNMNHNVHVLSDTDHDYKKVEEPQPTTTGLMQANTTEIKDEDNDDIDDDGGGGGNNNSNNGANGANKNDEAGISSEQYLRNFKPSLRDEQQFEAKLAMKGLQIISMGEDGNCLFRSISHQVYGKEDFHMLLRQKCVQYLKSEYEYFGSYVPGGHDRQTFDQYCSRMEKNGIWGDNLEIQAFSEIYGRSIEIYAYDDKPMKTFSNKPADDSNNNNDANINDNNDNSNNVDDNENHLNLDQPQQPKRERPPIRLSYHCNSHYNSIINPQLHRLSLLDDTKVGEVENEKIRLSYLRSVHANQSTVLLSDIEATDLAYFQQALKESRIQFEDDNNLNQSAGNQQLDEVIKKSLAQYEQDTLDQAKQLSMKEQEDMDLRKAIAISQFDFGTFGPANDGNNDAPDNHPNGNFNMDNFSNLAGVDGNYIIKQVVDRGCTLEQATMAWTVFESQKDQFSQETLIQKMIDYIQNITFSQNFYNLQ